MWQVSPGGMTTVGNRIYFNGSDGKKGEELIEDSLKTLEEEFAATFVRIHRNTLVNTKYLERIARDASGQHFVHLRGFAEPLEVSRRMAGDLKDRFRI